jgi:hypothetical protein
MTYIQKTQTCTNNFFAKGYSSQQNRHQQEHGSEQSVGKVGVSFFLSLIHNNISSNKWTIKT